MQVDVDSLQVEEAYYAEPIEILMIEVTDSFDIEVEQEEQNSIDVDEK